MAGAPKSTPYLVTPSLVSELSHSMETPYSLARKRIEEGRRNAFVILEKAIKDEKHKEIVMMLVQIAHDHEIADPKGESAIRKKLFFVASKNRMISADEFLMFAFMAAMMNNNTAVGERLYEWDQERSRDLVLNKSLCGCCFPAVRGKLLKPKLPEIIIACCEKGALKSIKWLLETYEPTKRDFVPSYDFFEECIQHSANRATKILIGDIRTVMYPGDDCVCYCCG